MPQKATQLTLITSDRLRLTADGRIVDCLDQSVLRPNTPEEHVRQNYARKLHHEYGYGKDVTVFNAPIQIGSDTKFADIAIYDTPATATRKDQGRIRLIVETKAPDQKSGQSQLKSYIFASSAEGGRLAER